MGERNRRLIKDIVGTWHDSWICRNYGLSEKELQSFKDRNSKEIVFKKLKKKSYKPGPARVVKRQQGNVKFKQDSTGTAITIY